MNIHRLLMPALIAGALTSPLPAEERTLTPEQMEALAKGEELADEQPDRPATLPDLTKGELVPPGKKGPPQPWYLGPTGIVGIMVGEFAGDQIQVQSTLKGSPAEGKFMWGDVIVGMNGKKFAAGEHLGYLIGNAIIEAEKEGNQGKISFQVWRDRNHAARYGKQDVAGVDVDKLFDEARDDDSLYEWKPEEERAKEVTRMGFDRFPIDPTTLEVELKLRVMPSYSDTAPYDCPKTNQILEDAWKVLEKKFVVDPKVPRSGRGGMVEAIALISSGKPEHRKLVHDWVRSESCRNWHPPEDDGPITLGKTYGMASWRMGYEGLSCALYYDATGDDFVLPALRKYAVQTAMGQSGGGTWGHTFAWPSFNGGELHKMNPGYGALNAAGNRCFFLITLAQKLGIKDPEIDAAVERSRKFFSSYVDQGCIPYGDHPAYGSDDSNGKNTGVAFSLKLLGDNYGAKYFAQMSTHASFTARGGHGHDYHGNWSSWAASICGPESRILAERNMRWRRTLCRMFDGSFVYHSPTGTYKALRDPTATEVLHQAVALKQTLITGKDEDKSLWTTEREMKQLLASALPQLNDPKLIERAGKPWNERSTDELLELLDIFYPKARRSFADELGRRFQAGEKEILPRLVGLLDNKEPRYRDGACSALQACGTDAVLENLSKITRLLDDPSDFVRITAVRVISKSTDSGETQLAMLKATLDDPRALAPNSVRNSTQGALFTKDFKLAESPFDAGFDEGLVRDALENLIELDPVGGRGFLESRNNVWSKDTVVRLAGPLVFAAEEEQINDQMFAGRCAPAQAMLGKFGYREASQATAHLLRKKAAIPRDIRPFVGFKRPLIDPDAVKKQPAAFLEFIEPMQVVLIDDPLTRMEQKIGDKRIYTDLDELYHLIKAEKKPASLPSIADDVRRMFQARLDEADGTGAKVKLCRTALKDPARKTYFEKMAAMDFLNEILGADALEDLLPYLGHDYWRLRQHAQKIATGHVTSGAGKQLAALFAQAGDAKAAAGILDVFALTRDKAGLEIAKGAMKHAGPSVRQAAIRTAFTLGGDGMLPVILAHLKNSATPEDLRGCEEALLSRRDDPVHAGRVRDAVIAMLPEAGTSVRQSLYHLLAQIGDPQCIAALRKAGQTDSLPEFESIVFALSYSPGREADQVLLDFAATNKASARVVGVQSVRRMVVGPKGYGDISSTARMDFAEAMLKLSLDRRLVSYLGHIHEARALRALMYCLEKGVESAAESLVAGAEGMNNLSPADAGIAAKSLRDVIEYIEVTRLRGGVQAHMDKDDKYVIWKALQARAGKVLLKVHKPEKDPIPEFDPLEIDP